MITLHIVVDEDLYYKLLELKAKMKAKSWRDFLGKVVKYEKILVEYENKNKNINRDKNNKNYIIF